MGTVRTSTKGGSAAFCWIGLARAYTKEEFSAANWNCAALWVLSIQQVVHLSAVVDDDDRGYIGFRYFVEV